jgi:hypothetical protein
VDQDFINWNGPVCSLAMAALRSAGEVQAADAAPFAAAGLAILGDPAASSGTAWREGLARLARARRAWAAASAAAGESVNAEAIMLRDELGHRRALYFPLSLRLHLSVVTRLQERASASASDSTSATADDALAESIASLRCDMIDASHAVSLDWDDLSGSAERGHDVATLLWHALTRSQAMRWFGDDVVVEDELRKIDSAVDRIIATAGPDGSLHEQGVEDTIDAWTFRELSGLHALADLSVQRHRHDWLAVVRRVAIHHLNNTQPDHITTQPWGVHAFSWWPDTMSFARQQIHDASLSGVATGRTNVSPVIGALLADAMHTSNQMANWTSKSGIMRIED